MAAAVSPTRHAFASPTDRASGHGILEAVTQVFNTTELLENILLFLDLRTLLLSKRVSRHFRNTMNGSIKIRKALFLEPLSVPNQADFELLENGPPKRKCGYCDEVHEYMPRHIPRMVVVNPLLDQYLCYSFDYMLTECVSRTLSVVVGKRMRDRLANSNPLASWRHMLVLQPHAAPIYIHINQDDNLFHTRSMRYGLQMDEFIEIEKKNPLPSRDAVQLYTEVLLTVGDYDIESLEDGEFRNGYDHRGEIADQICGWDVVGDRFGKQIKMYAPEFREPREGFGPRSVDFELYP